MPSSGDLPNPGIKPVSLVSPALASGSLPLVPAGKPQGHSGAEKLGPSKLRWL